MLPNNALVLASTANNANSATGPIKASTWARATFQAVLTGTPTGTLQVQGSNDFFDGPDSARQAQSWVPTNWENIGSSIAVSSSGGFLTPEIETCYEYMRVTYTDGSSGAATGTITIRAKSLGF